MSGQCITVRGAFKYRKSNSLLHLILSTSQTVFNLGRTLRAELLWRSEIALPIFDKNATYQCKKHLQYKGVLWDKLRRNFNGWVP